MEDLYFNLELPFYDGTKAGSHDYNSDLKKQSNLKNLPFRLYLDKETVIPRLYITKEIKNALNASYSNSSMISTPLGTSTLSNERMKQYLNILSEKCNNKFKKRKFVEIGSGTGHLLNYVSNLGADVIGFEIGPQGNISKHKFNLKVINSSFKYSYLDQKVDCIFSSGCLEHIIDLRQFILETKSALNQNGLFFASVPNSLIHFEKGSVEGLYHEHVNYFTPQNAIEFLTAYGFINCGSSLNKAGNEIFLWGYNIESDFYNKSPKDFLTYYKKEKNLLISYEKILLTNLNKKIYNLKKMVNSKCKNIGFYGGGHTISYLAGIQKYSRFFDGDEAKWGHKWMPGLSNIENPEMLIDNKVNNLIICVEHYKEEILEYLNKKKLLDPKMKVHLLEDI